MSYIVCSIVTKFFQLIIDYGLLILVLGVSATCDDIWDKFLHHWLRSFVPRSLPFYSRRLLCCDDIWDKFLYHWLRSFTPWLLHGKVYWFRTIHNSSNCFSGSSSQIFSCYSTEHNLETAKQWLMLYRYGYHACWKKKNTLATDICQEITQKNSRGYKSTLLISLYQGWISPAWNLKLKIH